MEVEQQLGLDDGQVQRLVAGRLALYKREEQQYGYVKRVQAVGRASDGRARHGEQWIREVDK